MRGNSGTVQAEKRDLETGVWDSTCLSGLKPVCCYIFGCHVGTEEEHVVLVSKLGNLDSTHCSSMTDFAVSQR